MVRLVVLIFTFSAFLAGCSAVPEGPDQQTVNVAALPDWQADGSMGSFTEGNHHPAIASLFAKAEIERRKQRWRSAMTYLDQARQIQPRNPAVFYRQAWVSLQMGDRAQARNLLQRGLVFAQSDVAMTERLNQLLAQCQ